MTTIGLRFARRNKDRGLARVCDARTRLTLNAVMRGPDTASAPRSARGHEESATPVDDTPTDART